LHNSRLISLLKTFSDKELKSFEKFIVSPYFSTGRDIRELFSALKGFYPDFDSSGNVLEKENLFKILYPLERYSERKLKNVTAALTLLAKKFLVHNSIEQSTGEFEKLLTLELKKRRSDKMFVATLNSIEDNLGKKLFDGADCFDEESKIAMLKEEFYLNREQYSKAASAKLQQIEYSAVSFLIRFLRAMKDRFILHEGFNFPFENPLLDALSGTIDFDKIIKQLEKHDYPMLWLIRMYYFALMSALKPGNRLYYRNLKSIFLKNVRKFSGKEKWIIFNDLLFYCHRNYSGTWEPEYVRESFDVYKEMLKYNAYMPNDGEYFNLVTFRNIVLVAMRLREMEWLNDFLKNYADKLKPEYRENMLNLYKGYLIFEEGRFEEALRFVNKVQYDVFAYKLDIKNILLKIFYELNFFEEAFSLADSYKHFLENTKEFSEPYKLQYRNFIKIYVWLLKAKSSGEHKNTGAVLSNIRKTSALAGKEWLLEKAKELT